MASATKLPELNGSGLTLRDLNHRPAPNLISINFVRWNPESICFIIIESPSAFDDARDNLKTVYIYMNHSAKQTGNLLRIYCRRTLQAFILFLHFGQVATTGIVSLIYFYIVYHHRTHLCAENPHYDPCRTAKTKLEHVPVEYIFVLTAVSFFFMTFAHRDYSWIKREKQITFKFFNVILGYSLIPPAFIHSPCQDPSSRISPTTRLGAKGVELSPLPIWSPASVVDRYPHCSPLHGFLYLPFWFNRTDWHSSRCSAGNYLLLKRLG